MFTYRNSRKRSIKQLHPAKGHLRMPIAKTFLQYSYILNALHISMHIPNDRYATKEKASEKTFRNTYFTEQTKCCGVPDSQETKPDRMTTKSKRHR